jgi:hypothetical protein
LWGVWPGLRPADCPPLRFAVSAGSVSAGEALRCPVTQRLIGAGPWDSTGARRKPATGAFAPKELREPATGATESAIMARMGGIIYSLADAECSGTGHLRLIWLAQMAAGTVAGPRHTATCFGPAPHPVSGRRAAGGCPEAVCRWRAAGRSRAFARCGFPAFAAFVP